MIYDDELPVGMGLYYDLPDMECYDFSQLFIDERYQGCGYGKVATK
ncbi:MAG: GNAT family N-acetyltransferase [Lachnospiraceae bacterium]